MSSWDNGKRSSSSRARIALALFLAAAGGLVLSVLIPTLLEAMR